MHLTEAVQIQLNGETREFGDGISVETLIACLDLEPSRVAFELNRNVVRRKDWAATTLHDGDRVEIVHFVGGG
jgi:sulfur carrier protein